MCGLVGAASPWMSDKEKGIFKQMLYAGVFRGIDSTGVARVNKKSGFYGKEDEFLFSIYKKAIPSAALLSIKDYKDWEIAWNKQQDVGSTKVMMGHNRAATLGAVNDKNAHPYEEGDIILAHNGTLWDMTNLDDHKYFDIDSQCIAYNVGKNGIEETVGRLKGAFALSWFDKEKKTLNFTRNSERPFAIVTCKDGGIYWASEEKMLEWILHRNNINYETSWELVPGQHFEFDLTQVGPKFSEFTVHEYKLSKEKKVYQYNNLGNRTYFPSKNDDYDEYDGYENVPFNKKDNSYSKLTGRKETRKEKRMRLKLEKEIDEINKKKYGKGWKEKVRKDEKKKEELTEREHLFRSELQNNGINPDKRIKVCSMDYEEYSRKGTGDHNQLGVIIGYIVQDPWMPIEIHGALRTTYNQVKDKEYFYTQPQTIRDDGTSDVVVCNGVVIISGIDDKQEKGILCLPGVKEERGGEGKKNQEIQNNKVEEEREERGEKDTQRKNDNRDMVYISPYGVIISEETMRQYTDCGCASCSSSIERDEYDNIHWLENGLPVCLDCYDTLESLNEGIILNPAVRLISRVVH